jgi:type II secretory pathway pseudopilin PulG
VKLKRKRAGLTLIETVIGVTIISIAFYAIIAVFINLVPRTVEIENIYVKSYLAQERIEECLTRGFAAVTNEAPALFSGDFSHYWNEIITEYVSQNDLNTPQAEASNFKKVKVRVWGGIATAAGTFELVTLVCTNETP